MKIVKTKDVVFKYITYNSENETKGEFTALKNISLEVNSGEFVAILGHNGSGKSTFAKLINALILPTKGTVWVKGLETDNDENTWEIRQSAGMVFQNPDNQIIATIVEEDVAFGLENLGIPSNEMNKRIDNALRLVSMEEHRKSTPAYLSGGQKQRIAIAGIVAMKPKCIIFDEPTAMLDPIGRKQVIKIIELLRKEGITIILITHFMEEAIKADRVVVMEKGNIVLDDKPKAVFTQVDRLKKLGLDVPQVTELAHNLNNRGINIPKDIITIDEMVEAICQLKSKT